MTDRELFWTVMEIVAAVLLLIPIAVEIVRLRGKEKIERTLVLLMAFTAVRLLASAARPFLIGMPHFMLYYSLLLYFSYIITLVNIALFFNYILYFIYRYVFVPRAVTCFFLGSCVVLALAGGILFSLKLMFHVDYETGRPVFEPTYHIMMFAAVLPMMMNAAVIIRSRKYFGKKQIIVFMGYMILTTAALPAAFVWNTSAPSHLITAQGVMWMYGVVYANQNMDAIRQKKALSSAQAKLVFSQMQPHFIFNALDTIYYLAGTEPERAKTAISDFSDYLRANFSVSSVHEPIPFELELQHIEKYLSLEKLRFEERLNIVWDIRARNFLLPPLSVQPLVENAVKHGVTKKRTGGTVTIHTEEHQNEYQITVVDNGVGFDPSAVPEKEENRSHIGISGVRRCLALMCGGTLNITSRPGIGTKAVITIPKTVATILRRRDNDSCDIMD